MGPACVQQVKVLTIGFQETNSSSAQVRHRQSHCFRRRKTANKSTRFWSSRNGSQTNYEASRKSCQDDYANAFATQGDAQQAIHLVRFSTATTKPASSFLCACTGSSGQERVCAQADSAALGADTFWNTDLQPLPKWAFSQRR